MAHCNDIACESATISTLDSATEGVFAWNTAVTIGIDGLGLIAYRNAEPSALGRRYLV